MADPERIGPYRVVRRLGAGGMGEVVLAHDDRLDRLVAIKRLHADHATTADRRERFRREARIAARLNHPAIVQLHDVLHQDDHDYLIMEYVEGRTLRERCEAGPMTVAEVLGVTHQIALGMAAAHDLGVIHRDLKAENVLITPQGRVKIADFGIAKLHGEDTITAEGSVLGTFQAMSPEQAQGHAIDHRSDLFSFGILLYEILAGVSPFRAETPYLTVQRLVLDDPPPLAEHVPAIPHDLASLVHQLLAKEPLLRPRDFHEVADALIELTGQVCEGPCSASSAPGHGPQLAGASARITGEVTTETGSQPARARAGLGDRARRHGPATSVVGPARLAAGSVDAPAAARSTTAGSVDAPAAARSTTAGSVDAPAAAAAAPAAAPGASQRAGPRSVLGYATAAGLAVVTTLGVGYALRDGGAPTAAPRAPLLHVAVLDPIVSGAAGRPDVALLATSVRNAVMAGVQSRVGLDLVPRTDVDSYVEGFTQHDGRRPGQRTIRAAVGADEVIATLIECVPSSCKITLEREGRDATRSSPASFQLAADNAGSPGDTVAVHLSRLYPDHPARDAARVGVIDPRDHERYVRLVQDYWAGSGALPTDEVLAELEGIRGRSPRSLDVLLFEADVRRHRYVQTADPEQARRAMALLQGADELAPDTYGIVSARFDIALTAGRLDDARDLLGRLALLDPDSSVTHLQRAKLHRERARLEQARGELERARDELDAAARRDSFSWRVLYYRALVSRDLGDRAATRAAIDELLRRSPGNYGGLSLLAREERYAGRLACAEQILARLVAREPLYQECVQLGNTLNQLGRYGEAAASFRRALTTRPADPTTLLNLAESLLLAGQASDARAQLRALHEILARKRRDTPAGALEGTDLLIEAQTLAYLGREDPALAAAARARVDELLARDASPTALLTAAMVHAVLGDLGLAATDVTRYLDGGGGPAPFGYPWFDELRRDPVMGPRLTVPPIARACDRPAP